MPFKSSIKQALKKTALGQSYMWLRNLYFHKKRIEPVSKYEFAIKHYRHISVACGKTQSENVCKLISSVDIDPVGETAFFYSIDCFRTLDMNSNVFGNYMVDYSLAVDGSLCDLRSRFDMLGTPFGQGEVRVIDAMREYLQRCRRAPWAADRESQLDAIESLFVRPAETLFEGMQRILFVNQFLWQTRHVLNGLGRMDKILIDLYQKDISEGVLTRDSAKEMIKEFFKTLHEYYWFKSNSLMGDTGQIVILGGREPDGGYFCNELTYLFIEASEELRLPDPKILLRCTADMPEDLLELALRCISTGIGAPLLSNDDAVIPAMTSCGYEEMDAYGYGTAACWEPLVPGISGDANNVRSLNFAAPLTRTFESEGFARASSSEEVVYLYVKELKAYIKEILTPFLDFEYDEDPIVSLFSKSALESGRDFTRGGAKYNNLGLTSVGLGTVVNSILNIEKLAFKEGRFTLSELNGARRDNFSADESLASELKGLYPAFGSDDQGVVALTRHIISAASEEFGKYKTKHGGAFKLGLSAPGYITEAEKTPATLDGRLDGEPFSVHISSAKAIPTTELLSFAMKLDYGGNRLNGNVVDFFVAPGLLGRNMGKFASLLRAGFSGGIFQLQMNVVDSKTLIAAKADPRLFPDLVVRVWGFSAYFNDLPEEYKDVLIRRAIESEKAA